MVYYAIVSQLENFFNLLLCVCVKEFRFNFGSCYTISQALDSHINEKKRNCVLSRIITVSCKF